MLDWMISARVARSPEGVSVPVKNTFCVACATAAEPKAEIDFIAKILDKDGKIVDARTFQDTAPVSGTDAAAYVKALGEVFAKQMTELVPWTTTKLVQIPKPPVTVSPPQALDEAPAPPAEEIPAPPSMVAPPQAPGGEIPPPVTVAPPEAPDQPMP